MSGILCGHAGSPERARQLADQYEGVHCGPETGDTIVVEWIGFLTLMDGHNARSSWDETIIRPDGGDEIVLQPVAPDQVLPDDPEIRP